MIESVGLLAGNRAVSGEVGVGSVAGVGHSLELSDEMAGAAVDRLSSEWAGQRAIECLHLVDDGIADEERGVNTGHVCGEKLTKTCIEKKSFADGVGGRG